MVTGVAPRSLARLDRGERTIRLGMAGGFARIKQGA